MAEVNAKGPFFATVGFSQGANVATALLAKQAGTGFILERHINFLASISGLFQDGLGPALHSEPLRGDLGLLGRDSTFMVVIWIPATTSHSLGPELMWSQSVSYKHSMYNWCRRCAIIARLGACRPLLGAISFLGGRVLAFGAATRA